MTSKPETVSQEAWDAANMAVVHAPEYTQRLHEDVARAIMAAKAEEREACAKVADEYVWDEHALAQATAIGKAVHHQFVEIAVAIRKRGDVNAAHNKKSVEA
jgi:hypothetical protein